MLTQVRFMLRIAVLVGLFLFTNQVHAATYTFIGNYHTFGNSSQWAGGVVPPSGGTNDIINIDGPCNFDIGFTIGPGTVMNCNAVYFSSNLNAFLINNGTLNVNVVFTLNPTSTITNNGTIVVAGNMSINGSLQNNSAGTITLNSGGLLEIRSLGSYGNTGVLAAGSGSTFDNKGNTSQFGVINNYGVITNTGAFTLSAGSLTNYAGGMFNANGTINLNSSSVLVNAGTVVKSSGTCSHNVGSTVTNNGSFTVTGGSFTSLGLFNGSGTYNGNLTIGGNLSPGTTAPATATVNGNYAQTGGLSIEIGSISDVLAVTGTATLGGTLTVTTVSGYSAPSGACGQTFDILTCSTRTGTFTSVNIPAGWRLTYLPEGVRLSVDPAYNTFIGGGSDQFWSNASNWLGCKVPADTVNYPINIAAPCIMDVTIAMKNTLTVDTMQLLQTSLNDSLLILSGGTLLNRGEVSGLGIMHNAGTIVNTHTILPYKLDNAGAFINWKTCNIIFANGLNNTGTLTNKSGAIIQGQSWTNALSGTVINQGVIFNSQFFTNLGLLKGTGEFGTSFINEGTLEPGLNNIGSMVVPSAYLQQASGTLKIEIGGTATSQYDQLIVSNIADLNGNIHISLVNGFVPSTCSEYQIVTAFSSTGNLTVVNQNPSDWEVIFGIGGVKLRYRGTLSKHTFVGGGGNTFWSNNDNWLECAAPPDSVILPVTITSNCWLDRDVVMDERLTLTTTGNFDVMAGKSLKITTNDTLFVNGHFTNYGLFELAGVLYNNHIFSAPAGSVNDFKAGSIFNHSTTTGGIGGMNNLFNGTVNTVSGSAFHIYSNATISSSGVFNVLGNLTVNGDTFTNNGIIDINAGAEIAIFAAGTLNNANTLTNDGTILVLANAVLNNQGDFVHNSALINEGTINNLPNAGLICNGTFSQNGAFSNNGTLSGTGSITPTAPWTNMGTIMPGGTPGTFTVENTCILEAGSLLDIEIVGANQHDMLSINGTAYLNGTLRVTSNYTPSVCSEFVILTASGVSGSFSNYIFPNGWAVEITSASVKLIYGGNPITQTFTNAAGDGLWTNRFNWDNCVVPYSATGNNNVHIVIAADCILDTDVILMNQLTIQPTKKLTIAPSAEFNISTPSVINVLGTLDIQGNFIMDGTLKGNGVLMGEFDNAGQVQPGTSPGTLTVTGNYSQDYEAYLDIEINGIAQGEFDKINIAGTAVLDGTLNVIIPTNLSLTGCTDFVILESAGLQDAFDVVNLPNLTNWAIRYTATSVIIRYTPGTSRNFVGTVNNLWSNDANWLECAAPPMDYSLPINILAPCALDINYNINSNVNITSNAAFTIQVGKTLSLPAGYSLNFYALTNNGTLHANGNLQMGFQSGPPLINNGALHVNTNSDLIYYRAIENTGTIEINAGSLVLNNTIASTGGGSLEIEVEKFIQLNMPSAVISTVDGAIDLTANTSGNTTGQFIGIEVNMSIISTGTGHITLLGNGGNGNFGNLSGIQVGNNARIECTGSGEISLMGTAGDYSASTSNSSAGILLGTNCEIKTTDGTIHLNGAGGSSGGNQIGIHLLSNSLVKSTGSTDDIIMEASGGSATGQNIGLIASGAISTHNADISIDATGGSTGQAYGMYVNSGTILSSGNGEINITGTGGGSGPDNFGIYLHTNGLVRGSTGPLTLSAVAGPGNSDGIRMEGSSGVHHRSGSTTIIGSGSGFGQDIAFDFGATVGADTTSGPINFVADTYKGGIVRGTGPLHIRPRTPATSIGIGFGNPGTLHLDNTDINNLQNGFSRIIIGDEMNGTGTITATGLQFQDPLTLVGGHVQLSGLSSTEGQTLLIARTGNVRDIDNGGYDIQCPELSVSTPNGALAPGNSPGLFRVNGNYTHTGHFEAEIAGTSGPGSGHDQLEVSGTLNLGGTLTVHFLNGFVPGPNDQFVLASATTLNGTFSTVNFLPAGANLTGTIQYINNQVILSNITALPVELTDLRAIPLEKTVQLRWNTASEVNNKGFFVERSTDAQHWQDLDFVPGSGNSTAVNHYHFEDVNPPLGTLYYRLRQTDLDGRFSMSNIVTVVRESTPGIQSVYPSPTSGALRVSYFSKNDDELRLQLLRTDGALVQQMWVSVANGVNTLELDLSTLPVAQYYLNIVDGSGLANIWRVQVVR
jgi:hypothetical protein